MTKSMLRAVLILPGTVLVAVPAGILLLTSGGAYAGSLAAPSAPHFWAAVPMVAGGLFLMARSIGLFARRGEGTLAPWDPPRRLVVQGIFRHVRNPMISGVIAVLLGEALLAQSLPLLGWAAAVLVANLAYIPLIEEPALERRFGEDYRRYRENVPRWIPRLSPWRDAEG